MIFNAGQSVTVMGTVASGATGIITNANHDQLAGGSTTGVPDDLLLYEVQISQLGPNAGNYGFHQGDTLRLQGGALAPLGTSSGPVTGVVVPVPPSGIAGGTTPIEGSGGTSTAPSQSVNASTLESKVPGISGLLGLVQGAIVSWDRLPSWAKWLLVGLGVAAGAAIVVDTLPADAVAAAAAAAGLAAKLGISLPGSSGGAPPNVTVAKSWTAGKTTFYLATNGTIWWKRKNGVWGHRRPVKPVVLVPGHVNIKQMVRGDKVLDREAKKVRKVLNKRAPQARPRRRQPLLPLVQELQTRRMLNEGR